jgi:hypothetical protein
MNSNLLRYPSMVALLAMSFTLAVPASAELSINRVDEAARMQILRDQVGASIDEVLESHYCIYLIRMFVYPVVSFEGVIYGLNAT